ncbi:MAG: NUDIX domain-containing protein [Bacteroidota bacterium]
MDHVLIKARLILRQTDKVLLLAQTSENGGKFTLPGGTVENTEFAKTTLMRECKEEIGITLSPNKLQLIHVLHKRKGKENRITLYFSAREYEGQLVALETEKFRGITWCLPSRLPQKTSATVKHVLQQIELGRLYSEFEKKANSANLGRKRWDW